MDKSPFQIIPEGPETDKEHDLPPKGTKIPSSTPPGTDNREPADVFPVSEHAGAFPTGGLSDEEVRDLDALIQNLKNPSKKVDPGETHLAAGDRIRSLEQQVAEMGAMLLKFDAGVKTLFELLYLFQRKSEILNQRIRQLEMRLR
ncbi:MAG: hypothetical protein JRI76_06105 [Deltaproteobacteria bacterium]|nr:hypothetical protein [Deltaproteobacteria bacterium]MBW1954970.1 hypothetical protein [Deltaproteobacteria bacterium]MBW2041594.1 hypothetical protein [Deltaproteobacteria bacterium]MBW2131684.1 hypothetical protein [Deltaproteobacteria bacterium]